MSRNVRNKASSASRKAAKRRDSITSSSSFDLSDEGGYSAVEDISDSSDDDEEDVDAAEEEHILHEVLPTPSIPIPPRPPIVQEEEDDDDDDDDDDDEEEEDEEEGQEQEDEDDGAADIEDAASWDGIMSEVDESAASDHHHRPAERHVRFDVPSSDSDSTDTEDDHADFFPDIFVDQSSLDPAFRREIEKDDENDESENSNSFWDYHGDYHGAYGYAPDADSDIEAVVQELGDDDTPIATPMTTGELSEMPTPVAALEETQELDGYETDGDTTEEDEPEPVVRRKIKRPEPSADQWDDSDTDHPVKGHRGQPRVGRFNLDNSERKPIAVVNPISRKMMIFTPHRRRQLDLSPEQFNFQFLAPIDENQPSPMMSSSAQIMMSAMFSSNTFGDYLNTQAMGPTEAFFPFQSEPNTADESSDVGFDEEEDDEVEKSLNISDFIEFDEGRSSADEDEDNQWDADPLNSTPARPRTASSDVDLHSHINATNVGAFRRDQINQRLILSDKATQDSLALSSPYNYTALRGLKSDRFETAAVPLTPLRRSKKQMRDAARSPLESMSQKRKASSEMPMGHKRHRSISDVNLLHI
ncbi:hypothetical protein HER10_EVM0008736 [Colletotrichum scovillei]|uniref:Amidase n=1 Tax=Colletotrichum scovillei TaxID=1209932 RepID=A0A9P7R5R2_9PEZI|nr:uncharacterized protein HER10_EVM0008736 [Colletotrichum scovillei]KAF4782182.1 hypothetical protein HER10_EVM0008736 [Colletotrichum scovillei]KAG7049718.1 amidase [Colletotrichum scovillei]KAG7068752.1 amidase [Colletotrichum scovillei]KAG7072710.1 amidase [Colletotrichum scovillei]